MIAMTVHDYARIEQAIAYLDGHFRRQPTVAEVAGHLGLSESHFHRLFQRWAGITPKRFLEYVTAAHARRRLAESTTVFDAALDAGLSGSGRLHDLFVSLQGVTPGEVTRRGRGLTLHYGVHASPFGDCFLAVTSRGVCALSFPGETSLDDEVAALQADWPEARLVADATVTVRLMRQIVAGLQGAAAEPMRLLVQGTNFQIRVWEALLRIPPGQVVSYGQVAAAAGSPNAVRAVGSAIGSNPVPLLIPCHRVIRNTGAFGNYSGGVWRKRALLAWEQAQRDQADHIDRFST